MPANLMKRKAQVLIGLSPKQYARIWVNAVRSFPSYDAFIQSEMQVPFSESLTSVLVQNVAEAARDRTVHWGPADQARSVRNALRDFTFLKQLAIGLNERLSSGVAYARPHGAAVARMLKLTVLWDFPGCRGGHGVAGTGRMQ